MSRLVALLGGGDWADASVEFLVVPKTVSLEKARLDYLEWRRGKGQKIPYMSFWRWLIDHRGALEVDEDDIEVFGDV